MMMMTRPSLVVMTEGMARHGIDIPREGKGGARNTKRVYETRAVAAKHHST